VEDTDKNKDDEDHEGCEEDSMTTVLEEDIEKQSRKRMIKVWWWQLDLSGCVWTKYS
jgi:hypothetical protein